jgi:hypothetical protein
MLQKLLNRLLTLRADLQGDMVTPHDVNGITPIAVAGAVTVYTRPITLRRAYNIGYSVQCTGSGPNVTITPQQAPRAPAAANFNAADPAYVTPTGVNAIGPFTDTNMHIATLSLVPMKYVRFMIVGNSGNGNDTKVDLELFLQELLS